MDGTILACEPPTDMSSPCVDVSLLDPVTRPGSGCRRTAAEIAGRAMMGEADRPAIMAAPPTRAGRRP